MARIASTLSGSGCTPSVSNNIPKNVITLSLTTHLSRLKTSRATSIRLCKLASCSSPQEDHELQCRLQYQLFLAISQVKMSSSVETHPD